MNRELVRQPVEHGIVIDCNDSGVSAHVQISFRRRMIVNPVTVVYIRYDYYYTLVYCDFQEQGVDFNERIQLRRKIVTGDLVLIRRHPGYPDITCAWAFAGDEVSGKPSETDPEDLFVFNPALQASRYAQKKEWQKRMGLVGR